MILTDKELSRDPAEYATFDEAQGIVEQLEWELVHSNIPGIGLAAPQIGINKAVAIVRVPNDVPDPAEPVICVNLVNPVLVKAYDLITYQEGCLSFPGLSCKTIRYNEVIIETQDDYEHHAEQLNSSRYKRSKNILPLFTVGRRAISLGPHKPEDTIGQLVSVCTQHEFSHLLGLTMYDFAPKEVGRNDKCPCGSDKKNKKCHSYSHYSENSEKLFKPNYKGIKQ